MFEASIKHMHVHASGVMSNSSRSISRRDHKTLSMVKISEEYGEVRTRN